MMTFQEYTPGQLDGQEFKLVKYAGNNTVALSAAVGDEIGTVRGKLQTGNLDVAINLLQDGLIRKMKASGVINDGDWVIGDGAGGIVTAGAGYVQNEATLVTTGHYKTALGKAIIPSGPSAAGDMIEVLVLRTLLVHKDS
jgi:hypothetical protein